MPLTREMMYCAARIIGDIKIVDKNDKVTGTRRGTIGTGFCLTVQGERAEYGYLLTADHVVEGQKKVEVQFADFFGEGEMYAPLAVTEWRRPPGDVDLAVAPLREIPGISARNVTVLEMEKHVIPNEKVGRVYLGSHVFYIGIFDPLDRPMARSGTIGALDQEGIEHDEGYVYMAHLVDCRSYDGFSGSPVFAELNYAGLKPTEPPVERPKEHEEVPIGQIFSTAMICGMFTEHVDENNADGAISRYGVGVMVRGEEITAALTSEGFVNERQEWDAEIAAQAATGPRLRNAGKRSVPADEFDRFEDLTRKLVQVPKPDKPL